MDEHEARKANNEEIFKNIYCDDVQLFVRSEDYSRKLLEIFVDFESFWNRYVGWNNVSEDVIDLSKIDVRPSQPAPCKAATTVRKFGEAKRQRAVHQECSTTGNYTKGSSVMSSAKNAAHPAQMYNLAKITLMTNKTDSSYLVCVIVQMNSEK